MVLKRTFNYSNIINLLLILSLVGLLPILDHVDEVSIEQLEQNQSTEENESVVQDEQVAQDSALGQAVAPQEVSLNELTNEELLQQFQQILDSTHNRSQIVLRGLKETEFLLEKASEEVQQITLPSEPDTKDLAHDEINKVLLEYRKSVVILLKQQLGAKEAEKALLDQYNKQLTSAYTDITNLLQESEKIDGFVLQVQLRSDEGSLAKSDVLEQFKAEQVEKIRQSLIDQQTTLTDKTQALKLTVEDATKVLDEIKKSVIEAESAQQTAQERYDQTQKRQELEKNYAKKSLKQLHAELKNLLEERSWLYSTLSISLRNFVAQQAVEAKIAKKIEEMGPPPENTANETTSEQNAETDQYFKDLDAYHKNRLKILQTHHDALEILIKKGELVEGDARVLGEPVFKMSVIAEVFERLSAEQKNSEIVLSPVMTSESIRKYDEDLSAKLSEALTAVSYATEQLAKITQMQTQSTEAIKQAEQSLINLKKAHEAQLEIQKWETALKKLTAEQVAAKFVETSSDLQKKLTILEQSRTDFAQAEVEYTEVMHKLEALQDPFARELQAQKQDERYELLKQLYQFAGLEPPEPEVPADTTDAKPTAEVAVVNTPPSTPMATTTSTDSTTSTENTTDEAQNVTPAEQPAPVIEPPKKPDADVIDYQAQLSSWLRIDNEQNKQSSDMLNILNKVDSQITAYLAILDEVHQLTKQQQATAMEVKKRVGRTELKDEQIPEGVAAALKSEQITVLTAERTQIRNQQLQIKDEIARLSQVDDISPQINKIFDNVNTLTGKLLDSLDKAHKLATDFSLEQEALDPIQHKILEQSASRRIRTENSVLEFLFGYFESQEISILTEILQSRYLKLTEQEGKQQLLKSQEEKYENGISYLQEEKTMMTDLLPLLQSKLTALQAMKEEETVKAQARIAPDRAKELLTAFESEKGHALVVPPPFPEEEKVEGINYLAKNLFALNIKIQALEKWISLFQARTQPSGIDAKIGQYQDVIAELQTKNSALQRYIAGLIGYTSQEISQFTKEEKPTTSKEWARVKEGEIGVLRADRLELYKENIYLIVIKIVVILIGTFLTLFLVNFFIKRSLNRAQAEIDAGKRTDTSLISVMMLLHKVSKFFIIGTSFILCLDAIGMNTGAILAGLGIGGIGIAMASKDILSDIFAGVTIMVMGLYKIGDIISFKGTWYIVKEIGIRHTTLKDFNYSYQVSMPNGKLAETEIVNVSSHAGHIILKNLYLATTNSTEKMQQAILLIEEVIKGIPAAKFVWAKHAHFDDYSFALKFYYNVQEFKLRHKTESEVNATIVKRFQENGIKFASFPVDLSSETPGMLSKI